MVCWAQRLHSRRVSSVLPPTLRRMQHRSGSASSSCSLIRRLALKQAAMRASNHCSAWVVAHSHIAQHLCGVYMRAASAAQYREAKVTSAMDRQRCKRCRRACNLMQWAVQAWLYAPVHKFAAYLAGSERTKTFGFGTINAMRTMSESRAMMACSSSGETSAHGRSTLDRIFTSPSPCSSSLAGVTIARSPFERRSGTLPCKYCKDHA